jgi:hypothetical protein
MLALIAAATDQDGVAQKPVQFKTKIVTATGLFIMIDPPSKHQTMTRNGNFFNTNNHTVEY